MSDLDDTDLEILSLLAEDARRPFSGIGEAVGLSGPAVSERVRRLEEAGVIRRFTVDVDRGTLRGGVPVFVRFENDPDDAAALRDRVEGADGVEHVFVTAEGEVWCQGRAVGTDVRRWVEALLDGGPAVGYTVTLVDETSWTPVVGGTELAVACAECGNTVDSEGVSTRVGGERRRFCCDSCRRQFAERFERFEEGA